MIQGSFTDYSNGESTNNLVIADNDSLKSGKKCTSESQHHGTKIF